MFCDPKLVSANHSVVSDSLWPNGLSLPASLSMEFSTRGLPFPSPGDLPDPGTEPGSPALQADTLRSKLPGMLDLSLLWWGTFLFYLICWEFLYHERVEICQILFLTYWDNLMIFILHSVNVVCHSYLLAYIEASLNSRDKFHLVMASDPFDILLNLVC